MKVVTKLGMILLIHILLICLLLTRVTLVVITNTTTLMIAKLIEISNNHQLIEE